MYYNNILNYDFFDFIKGVTVQMMSFTYFSYASLFQDLERNFNIYSNKNNLDIKLEMVFFSEKNSTRGRSDHSLMLDTLLNRKSVKYDMYIFDPILVKKLSSHFLDLKEWLPNEYIDLYNLNDVWKISVYDNKWVGLPLFIKFMVLYSNRYYLEKYNKEVPTTWDKLLETGQFILEQERINNKNFNLYGYNGLFPTNFDGLTSSMCSAYQYIYSNRENKNSTFPEINSEIVIKSLNKLKEIKEKLSSDELFKLNEDETIKILMEEKNLLFATFWDSVLPKDFNLYIKSILPGRIDGISGSCLGGYNLGISDYIDEEHKKASIEVFKFIFSKEFQRDYIIKKYHQYSGIMELYKENETCSNFECDILTNLQFIERPIEMKNYEEYELKFLEYFYKFLYYGKDIEKMVQKIEEITKFYYLKLKNDVCGIIIFSILNVIFIIVLISLLLNFVPNIKFKGILIILSSLFPSIKPEEVISENNKNFYHCYIDTSHVIEFILFVFELLYHAFLFIALITFLFIELNNKKTLLLLKNMFYIVGLDCVSIILLVIIEIINTKNYYIECFSPLIIHAVYIFKHIYALLFNFSYENSNNDNEDNNSSEIRKLYISTNMNNSMLMEKKLKINFNDSEMLSKSEEEVDISELTKT
ncbi:periplasmic binding protein-like II [Neocallimastix californiae]|uniref:Periplasmic binding protein-like II n=1 Tax=Neocallimastix californiae TaxID=1754190 RepID=A0A1Y2D6W4_9FUNG|nr:periplasmic binding protein-like II [Neocallimastix californiae]|eukprot:ORY54325.1 periplasmic binding protein-like II [Neocallimastix californiae]